MSQSLSVPNTLTITINTRLQDELKLKYKPNNTILNYDGLTIYFNPLIKLNQSVINAIPDNVSRNYLFTQFFNEKQFNSLLQRTLSNPSTMQPKRTMSNPDVPSIISNNIALTLNTLFSKGRHFYISSKPYTIYSYAWSSGQYNIDTKRD